MKGMTLTLDIKKLLEKPIWQLTGDELITLMRYAMSGEQKEADSPTIHVDTTEKRYVYGIRGIARLFDCSLVTANRIKQSGRIDRAITQLGRKIIVDANLALELAKVDNSKRKKTKTNTI